MRFYHLFFIAALMMGCDRYTLPDDVELASQSLPEQIDYNKHVKKILSDKCFSCHGPDAKKQKAGLRLDLADFAYNTVTESGRNAIHPGSLSKSELIHRILSEDAKYKMPSPESHLELTSYEKAILVKWIDQGAEYKKHWAFVAPEKKSIPKVEHKEWVKNDIDRFIVNMVEEQKLHPTSIADKETLIRRLSFDIRGISPSIQEIDAFVQSKDPNAYEHLVDAFLASKHYGERMSAYWLDAARFADSHGYLDDKHHDMSPWRDWVISAYNRNIPFNDFITWQLAGDLIPNHTKEQLLATGFNRNHKQNTEAGIIEEEFRVEYVVDRTNTLGTALLGMTVGCAKCHDHKFDPISQKDYYSMFAFFNSTFEKGSPNYGDQDMVPGPTMMLTSNKQDQQISQLNQQIRMMEKHEQERISTLEAQQESMQEKMIGQSLSKKLIAKLGFDKSGTKDKKDFFYNEADPKLNAMYRNAEFGNGVLGKSLKYNDETYVNFPAYDVGYFERYQPFSYGMWLKIGHNEKKATIFYSGEPHRYGYQGYDLLLLNNKINVRLINAYPHNCISVIGREKLDTNQWYHVAVSYDGSSKASGVTIYLNGKKINTDVEYDGLIKHMRPFANIHKGDKYNGLDFGRRSLDKSFPGGEIDEFHMFNSSITGIEVNYLFNKKPLDFKQKKDSIQVTTLMQTRKALCDIYDSVQQVMVMGDLPKPRPSYVLKRGIYDSYGEQVQPSMPASILPYEKDLPKNRMGLAKWLFDEKNPLTSRVAVNRVWQLIFGKGLVKTSDDFGNQGDMPLQQDLLDHLAIWYREHGWDTKALMKYIFMSATYQQSSITDKAIIQADPNNEYFTRNPRYRLPAEMIRDNALAISNLLSEKVGGKSVYPYQPEGLWDELSDKNWRYKYLLSEGEDKFRKSIYTVRKRTSVVPFLQIFDAPDRSVCTVKRAKSSSPMQSLAMLNDPQMVEASRFVGLRMMKEGGSNVSERLRFGFRLVTGRNPNQKEVSLLIKMYDAEVAQFQKTPDKACEFLLNGTKDAATTDTITLAAMSTTALALMNTDEFLTRK